MKRVRTTLNHSVLIELINFSSVDFTKRISFDFWHLDFDDNYNTCPRLLQYLNVLCNYYYDFT